MSKDPLIGVAITTHNRQEIALESVQRWRAAAPPGTPIVVVDDGSDIPFPGATFRFDTPQGIARAKNKGIELLIDAGVEHLFLSDDDTWPVDENWWVPYVRSPHPHLMYLFKDPGPRGHLATPATVYSDKDHFALAHPRGCMLYVESSVISTVGGMDVRFGRWGWEHVEFSERVYAAGLTPAPFVDVQGSHHLWHSMDEKWFSLPGFERSVPREERESTLARNEHLAESLQGRSTWVPYREAAMTKHPRPKRNAVVTFLLNGTPDTQRGRTWDADPEMLRAWGESISGGDAVVISDCLTEPPGFARLVQVAPVDMNVYFARWVHAVAWLKSEGSGYDQVFFTDGTDVTMVREPWERMSPSSLYLGDEPVAISTPWMRQQMRDPRFAALRKVKPNLPLLNAGVIGGSPDRVERFLRSVLRYYYSHPDQGIGDNAALNLAAYQHDTYPDVVHGPEVTNVFKSYQDNGRCWFMHK